MISAINFKSNYFNVNKINFGATKSYHPSFDTTGDSFSFTTIGERNNGVTSIESTDELQAGSVAKAKNTVQKVEKLLTDLKQIVPVEYAKSIEIAQDAENKLLQGIQEHRFSGKGDEIVQEFEDGKLAIKSEFYDGILRNVKVYGYDDDEKCDMYVYFNATKPAHVVKGIKQTCNTRQYDKLIGVVDCEVGAYEERARVDKDGDYRAVELIGSHNSPSVYRENALLSHGKFSADNVLSFDNDSQPSTYAESMLSTDGKIIFDGKIDLADVE